VASADCAGAAGALTGLPARQIEALLLHELAHIRRHDYLVHIVQSVVEAVFFYHPGVWWISGHMRTERELCCDDIAVSISGNALIYARALAEFDLARFIQPAVMAANGGSVADRIARLLGQPSTSRRGSTGTATAPALILLAIGAWAVCAQSPVRPQFEVASVKLSKAPDAVVLVRGGMMDSPNGRYRVPSVGDTVNIGNWTLGMCIAAAWDLGAGQMSGPAWLGSDRYDIMAKTSPQATQPELRMMLQALLADRFKLATHRVTKDLPTYALVAVKNGSKLIASTGDERSPVMFAPPSRLIGHGSTMQGLALALARAAGRPVVDKTGIRGAFDFSLSYSPENIDSDTSPSILTALEEQLGLRLVPEKSPTEILVVDHAERIPTEN
jgi:bla regulator protein blaR1